MPPLWPRCRAALAAAAGRGVIRAAAACCRCKWHKWQSGWFRQGASLHTCPNHISTACVQMCIQYPRHMLATCSFAQRPQSNCSHHPTHLPSQLLPPLPPRRAPSLAWPPPPRLPAAAAAPAAPVRLPPAAAGPSLHLPAAGRTWPATGRCLSRHQSAHKRTGRHSGGREKSAWAWAAGRTWRVDGRCPGHPQPVAQEGVAATAQGLAGAAHCCSMAGGWMEGCAHNKEQRNKPAHPLDRGKQAACNLHQQWPPLPKARHQVGQGGALHKNDVNPSVSRVSQLADGRTQQVACQAMQQPLPAAASRPPSQPTCRLYDACAVQKWRGANRSSP